jgi:hypothetical protein
MWNTENADRKSAERGAADTDRPRLPCDKREHPFSCLDCARTCTIHRLKDEVWLAACPNYHELKRTLIEMYAKDSRFADYRVVLLCFRCVEHRLGRLLTRADFSSAKIHDDLFYLGEIVNRPVLRPS